jgi:threonine/homoserine/homoserine lactone efflux protein
MTPFIAHLLPAVALGLCVAIPFGPIALMCVQRTLAFGVRFGIASGMGAATAHGITCCFGACRKPRWICSTDSPGSS